MLEFFLLLLKHVIINIIFEKLFINLKDWEIFNIA